MSHHEQARNASDTTGKAEQANGFTVPAPLQAACRAAVAALKDGRAADARAALAPVLDLGATLGLPALWVELLRLCHRAEWPEGQARVAGWLVRRAPSRDPGTLLGLADALVAVEAWAEAERAVCLAGLVVPGDARVAGLRAVCRFNRRDARGAARWARRGLALVPRDPRNAWTLSLALLSAGDLAEGWQWYEAGFAAGRRWPDRRAMAPAWRGEILTDQRLVVWSDQGIGDQIRFASCLPDVRVRVADCVLEAHPRLVDLFARSFPGLTVRPQTPIDDTGRFPVPADADRQIALGSLPGLVRPRLADFPASGGYLVPDPGRLARWRARLADLPPGPRVGIAWRSRLNRPENRKFHTVLDDWGPILGLPGLCFVNLQYDRPEDELAAATARFGVPIHHWPDYDPLTDIEDAAALAAAVDIIVSVFTSTAELAAAMGRPTLVPAATATLMDHLGTDHSPWFPTMRLFFRSDWRASWASTMGRVAEALATLTRQPSDQ